MSILSISKALTIQNESALKKNELLQAELELNPDTFFALFWLYTHDFLYISPFISEISGHPLRNFEKHGLAFFQSIIPPDIIENIYQSMYFQAEAIQNHPDYLFAEEFLHIKAAVFDPDKNRVPVNYNAVLMDEKAFDPILYLVFCSWIDTRNKTDFEVSQTENYLKKKLLRYEKNIEMARPVCFWFDLICSNCLSNYRHPKVPGNFH